MLHTCVSSTGCGDIVVDIAGTGLGMQTCSRSYFTIQCIGISALPQEPNDDLEQATLLPSSHSVNWKKSLCYPQALTLQESAISGGIYVVVKSTGSGARTLVRLYF